MTVVYNPAKQASSAGRRCPGSIQGLCPGVVCTTWRLDACRHSANQCLAFLVAGTSARLIVVNWTAPVSICPRTGVERLPVFRPQWPLPIALIVWGVASLKFLRTENMTPHFSADVYYGKTAGWIRILLGTQVGDSVLDGYPARLSRLHAKGHSCPTPLFGPLLWPASPKARILPITRIVDYAVHVGRLSWPV